MSPGRLKITDKTLGKVKAQVKCRLGEDVLGVSLSADGTRTAFGSYTKLAYFVGKKQRFSKDITKFSRVLLSGSGERILLTTYEACELLDEFGREVWEYEEGEVVDLSTMSADGEVIVVAADRKLHVFDPSNRRLWNHTFPERIWSLAVSENGDRVAVGTGKAIYYFQNGKISWDFRTGKLVLKVCLSPEGRYCSFTSNRHVFLFNANGLMEWSKSTEYCRELGMASDGSVVGVGMSVGLLALNGKGQQIFDYESRDFITRVEVAGSGECMALGNGSDIFRSSELICMGVQGRELWRYRAHGRINDIAISETGRYVAFCDNRKGMVVDNRMLVSIAARRVIEETEGLMQALVDEDLDVAQEKKLLIQAWKDLESNRHEEALRSAKKAYALGRDIKESFVEAGERVPGWMKKLGYKPTGDEEGIGPDLVRTAFPIYIMHKKLEENTKLKNLINRYQKRYNSYVESRKTIDLEQLRSDRGEESDAVKEMELRMLRSSTASLSLNRLISRLEQMDNQRIQYIFELENKARSIILDRIDGKDCKAKVREAETAARVYFKRMEAQIEDIAQQALSIDTWFITDMEAVSQSGLELSYDYSIKAKDFKFVVTVVNRSPDKHYRPALFVFTNLDEAEIIAPASGMERSAETLGSGDKVSFSFLVRMDAAQNQGVNGYLEFMDKKNNATRVKIEPFSPDVLVPFIEPLILNERQYTATRSKGKGKTFNKSLDIRSDSMKEMCDRVISTGGEMFVARGIPDEVDGLTSAILWLSGQLNNEKILGGFTLTKHREQPGSIHIDMSVYCRNEDYAHKFLGEFEKKLTS